MEGGEGIASVLSVLLFVLKWIGILLLGLIGLVILLLLLICLVPIRYEVKGRYHEQLKAKADVSWLLQLIHFWVGAINLQVLCKIKVLGHCFKKFHIGKWGDEAVEEAEPPAEDKPPEKSKKESAKQKKAAVKEKQEAAEKEKEKEETAPPKKKDKYDRLFEALDREERRKAEEKEKAEKSGDGAEEKGTDPEEGQSLGGKARHWKQQFQEFWEDEKNRDAVDLIKRQVQKLVRHLLPTHFLLEGDIGLKDPAATGELIAKVYRLYPIYGDHIRLNGVFDRPMAAVYAEVGGRIRLGVLVEILIRLLLNKRCRQWVKKLRS